MTKDLVFVQKAEFVISQTHIVLSNLLIHLLHYEQEAVLILEIVVLIKNLVDVRVVILDGQPAGLGAARKHEGDHRGDFLIVRGIYLQCEIHRELKLYIIRGSSLDCYMSLWSIPTIKKSSKILTPPFYCET